MPNGEVPSDVMAVIVAAVDAVWPRPVVIDPRARLNDNQGPGAPAVSASSPPLCDQVLQSDFKLVFGPKGPDYSKFRFREQFVVGSQVLNCNGVVTPIPSVPRVSAEITLSLSPDGWVDLNGLSLAPAPLDTLLPMT